MSNTTHLSAVAERLKEATAKLGTGDTDEEREENHRKFKEAGEYYVKALLEKVKSE